MSPLRTVMSLVALALVFQPALALPVQDYGASAEGCNVVPRYNTVSKAADIIFVVDISSSMQEAHRWLVNIPKRIDTILTQKHIGNQITNKFHIFTFGQSNDRQPQRLWACDEAMCAKSAFKRLANQTVQGSYEDGLQAIAYAINNTEFRENTPSQAISRHVILVTDEDRDSNGPISQGTTRRSVKKLLKKSNITLTSVVDCTYKNRLATPGILGLGRILSRTKNANGKTSVVRRGIVATSDLDSFYKYIDNVLLDRSYQNSWKSYASLATEVNGSTWNINLLKQGIYRNTFTAGFIESITFIALRDTSRECCSYCGGIIHISEHCTTCEEATDTLVGVQRSARQQEMRTMTPEVLNGDVIHKTSNVNDQEAVNGPGTILRSGNLE